MSGSRIRAWVFPLVVFQLYLIACMALYFFGPWPWQGKGSYDLFWYLCTANIMILAGYLSAWMWVRRDGQPGPSVAAKKRWLLCVLAVSVIMALPTSLSRVGTLFPDVVSGLFDPGTSYNANITRMGEGGSYVVIEYIRMAVYPLLLLLYPLTIIYWSSMGWVTRIVAVALSVFYIAVYVAAGQNKGAADAILLLPFLLVLAARQLPAINIKGAVIVAGALLVIGVGFFSYFGATQTGRAPHLVSGGYNFGREFLQADPGHPVSRLLPPSGRVAFESIARYLGQGYETVYLSLPLDHESTLGAGNSMFLSRNVDRVLGTDLTSQSLPAILEREFAWPMYTVWHSIYPWLASDVGYPGALLVLGGFSLLLGLSWGKSLATQDPIWIAAATTMLILFIYIPANNQIFQSGESFVGFFIIWGALFARWAVASLRSAWKKEASEL